MMEMAKAFHSKDMIEIHGNEWFLNKTTMNQSRKHNISFLKWELLILKEHWCLEARNIQMH